MIPETLVTVDLLQHKGTALTQGKTRLFHNASNFFHDLFMQLGIRGEGDILFLDRRINKGRIMMTVFIIPIIHTNVFLEDKLNPLFTDTFAEMDQFRRGTRGRRCELLHATEILIISVLAPLFYQRLI